MIVPGRVARAPEIAVFVTPPLAMLRQTTAQSITSGTAWWPLNFEAEDIDTDPEAIGGHDLSVNISRYTARYPGMYQLGGGVMFASNATGRRGCAWAVNGNLVNGCEAVVPAVNGGATGVAARTIFVPLLVGDYVELMALQNSGAALSTLATTSAQSSVCIKWQSS